jgi:GNAT superfamily N-acetyltransferase
MMIREGTISDIFKVSRLWRDMVLEMKPDWKPNLQWWRDYCQKFLEGGNYFIFVDEDGERLNGFVDMFLFPEPSTGMVHLIGQHFYVRPYKRKTTIAGHLYRKALHLAKQKGVGAIDLFCFDNEKPMWEKRGFSQARALMRMEV